MNSTVSIVLALSAMAGFGVADFFTKVILSKAPALRTALISQGVGTVLFLGVSLYFDFGVPSNSVIYLTLLSGVLSAIALCSYYVALSLEKASLVCANFCMPKRRRGGPLYFSPRRKIINSPAFANSMRSRGDSARSVRKISQSVKQIGYRISLTCSSFGRR